MGVTTHVHKIAVVHNSQLEAARMVGPLQNTREILGQLSSVCSRTVPPTERAIFCFRLHYTRSSSTMTMTCKRMIREGCAVAGVDLALAAARAGGHASI